jgi:hypothetical protein
MKLLYCLLLLLFLISFYQKVSEGFTTYQIDYGTGIGPWWAQGPGLGRGFHRCICSSSGDCRCINDSQFQNTSIYPQYYFN